jgi:hypothetical protein
MRFAKLESLLCVLRPGHCQPVLAQGGVDLIGLAVEDAGGHRQAAGRLA